MRRTYLVTECDPSEIDPQPEIILFVDVNFGGLHTHIYRDVPNLSEFSLGGVSGPEGAPPGTWADIVSSVRVVAGTWEFFSAKSGKVAQLGPGLYEDLAKEGIANDTLTSIKLVPPQNQ